VTGENKKLRRYKMKRVSVFITVSAFIAVCFLAWSSDVKAAAIDIKITTVQLKQQQMGDGIDRLAKYMNANLGNKVRVRTYPAAQLYTGQEETQAVMKGELQMAFVIGSALEPIDESQELMKLPFLFPDVETMYKVLDGPLGKKLYAKLDQKGLAVLGVASSGDVVISNSKRPIKSVEDFNGLKMRSFGRMGAATLKTLGALSIVTASEETYTALQQGVIEGCTVPNVVFLARKYYDVQKYVTGAGMMNATLAFLIANKTWWEKLPPDVKKGTNDAITKLLKEMRAEIEADNKKVFDQIAAKGSQVHMLTATEQAAFKKALQPVYTEFTPIIGTELVTETQKEVERLSKAKK
jgi:C4-dicarboxylate-binding protein DctP